MTKAFQIQPAIFAGVALLLFGCGSKPSGTTAHQFSPTLDSELRAYFRLKEAQARELQERDKKEFAKADASFAFAQGGLPSDVRRYFAAGKNGDWSGMSDLFSKRIAPRSYQFEHPGKPDERYATTAWQPINEAYFAYRQLAATNPKQLEAYGRYVSDSLPTNSIYFAGTDAGRFVVDFTSLARGRPRSFTIISPSQLVDGLYRMEYLRATSPAEIQLLTEEDTTKSFTNYLAAAQRRLETNQLKPGESAQVTNGRVQVSGMVPAMEINAQLAQILFDKNPAYEFFVDYQNAFEWAYPHVEPYGFILRINRKPLSVLGVEAIQRDFQFWNQQTSQTIGVWLNENTTVTEVCDWIETVFLQKNLNGFTGDVDFIGSGGNPILLDGIYGASAVFSKSRANIADVYAWRAANPRNESERQRMVAAADFAFRQALALGPAQLDAGRGYFNFLWAQSRYDDALRLIQTVGKFRPDDKAFQRFIVEVEVSIKQMKPREDG